MELLLEGRQPRLGALEPAQRLIDCGQARFGDPCRLGIELPHGLFVRLLERAPLMLQAALELVDARGRLVQQPALDIVPLAKTTMELDDGRRVLFVVFRPPIEDAGAVARHVGETRLEPPHRFLRETKLLESDIDLFELQLEIGFTLLDRQFTIRRASLFHLPPMIDNLTLRQQEKSATIVLTGRLLRAVMARAITPDAKCDRA